jgi:hypothetical protein
VSEGLWPDWFDAWAAAHRPLLELIVERLLAAGEWPTEAELQRQLVLDGTPIAVADAIGRMPRWRSLRIEARHPAADVDRRHRLSAAMRA